MSMKQNKHRPFRFKIGMESPYPDEGETLQFHVGFTTVFILDSGRWDGWRRFGAFWCPLTYVPEARREGIMRMDWCDELERSIMVKNARHQFKRRWLAILYGIISSPFFHLWFRLTGNLNQFNS